MNEPMPFEMPSIGAEDIAWACDVLKLPQGAFDDANRTDVLRSSETIDVAACPGSGKTTLLVAKLAILARRWTDRRRGICVLSHTNVARHEIENRLGNTAEGQKLLSHPHFIGTIHGFVNQYLALPGARLEGLAIQAIDDALCETHRRNLLKQPRFAALSTTVERKEKSTYGNSFASNIVNQWFVSSADFDVEDFGGKAIFKDQDGRSAKQLRLLVDLVAKDGFHRHDEMIKAWAPNLIDKYPAILAVLRTRFPLLLVDETQDNSELQSDILSQLFTEGDSLVIRQRFGDSNQAIYDHVGQSEDAKTDAFPDKAVKRDIHNSYRFGLEIAALADPLGIEPQGLIGQGPDKSKIKTETSQKHAILLFDDDTRQAVLKAFGDYLISVFDEDELRQGHFSAIGAVHKTPDDEKNKPKSVCDYWPDYDPQIARSDSRPSTFLQYISAGRRMAEVSNTSHAAVDRTAEGILQLVRIAAPAFAVSMRKRRHLYVREMLEDHEGPLANYLELIGRFAVEGEYLSNNDWKNSWREKVKTIANAVCGGISDFNLAVSFLNWGDFGDKGLPNTMKRDNFFRHPTDHPKVKIRVGSIHSVKGETHTGTLVLETYNRAHHLLKLKPSLQGRGYTDAQRTTLGARLKLHYVAMTRPSHLLCVAIPKSVLKSNEAIETVSEKDIAGFIKHGWRVGDVQVDGDVAWRME